MHALIENTGLTRSALHGQTNARLYGVEQKHVVEEGGAYQDPMQLARAMQHLGRTVNVRTYMEFGVWTAWTFTLMSSYLSRVGTGPTFRARAIDVEFKPAHREKHVPRFWPFNACVARPVGRKEMLRTPAVLIARDAEWQRLNDTQVWDIRSVREWKTVAREAREQRRKHRRHE